MHDAGAPDERVPSDGEASVDDLSRRLPSTESSSDAPEDAIVPSGSSAATAPSSHGTRRRHRHRRRRIRPIYLAATICAVIVAGLLLASQVGWPLAASPSVASPAVGPSSVAALPVVTPFASYPGFATTSAPVVVGSPTAFQATPTAASSPHPTVANRIVIARLGIDMKIIEGDGVDAPLGKVAHYPGTAWPGGGSNIYLYAHARDGMFITLWNASIGDEIVLTLLDGSQRRYVVSQIRPNVTWNDMSVLAPTPTEQLTLQTCTSYQETAPRFLVIAVPEQ
jgi:LPXTG-site transpeptidase (sortase) family protein